MTELQRTIDVVKKLRDPQDGCPWDLEQTHESLLRYLLEESYEFIEAVEKKAPAHMKEELGDVLLQVLLHARIAEQSGGFTLEDVAKGLADKLIHRHPHVFGQTVPGLTPDEVRTRWEDLKAKEKGDKPSSAIPAKLLHNPALRTSHLIGNASSKIAFDWENYQQVIYKVEEEWQELKEELPLSGQFNPERVAEELGDLLFSVAQLSRHLGFDAEEVLRQGNRKFLKRFHCLEEIARERGLEIPKLSQAEMETLWSAAKARLL
jgi:MazG family protein